MWPWGHAAVAYLFVTVFARFDRRRPTEREVLAVFLASQLPDVVDKPLAWTLGVLPNGRSLAHSLVIASLVILVVVAVARTRDRPAIGAAVGIGYLSHLVADAFYPVVTGNTPNSDSWGGQSSRRSSTPRTRASSRSILACISRDGVMPIRTDCEGNDRPS